VENPQQAERKDGVLALLNRKGSLGLFTPAEKAMMEQNQRVQKNSMIHVREVIYYNIITKITKEYYPEGSPNAGEPYFLVMIDDNKINQIDAKVTKAGNVTKKQTEEARFGYPYAVAIEENGDIWIRKTQNTESRKIDGLALLNCHALPPPPKPPVLKEATLNQLRISWEVPFEEFGLVQRMEVHYRSEGNPDPSRNPWQILFSKSWLLAQEMEHTLGDLHPYQGFFFKVRAESHIGAGEFSEPSGLFRTRAGPPAAPITPIFAQVTNNMIVLLWRPPRSNGFPILNYTLRYKQALPHASYTEIQAGEAKTFTIAGLQPDTGYCFELKCENAIGSSEWSPPGHARTQKTKSNQAGDLAALRAGEFWMECWDPKEERVFYFHKVTGERTIDIPEEFAKHKEENKLPEDPMTIFRKKRYNFIRNLHLSLKKGFAASSEKILTLEVRRDLVFEDSFNRFSAIKKGDLHRRTKIIFTNEEGIDSGGLTKDWFLLLSRCFASSALKLFTCLPSGELELASSGSTDELHLQRLRFVGRVLAKAIFDRQMVHLPMCTILYKHILGMQISLDDIAELDPVLFKSLSWMHKSPIENIVFETFSVFREDTLEEVDLKENGSHIDVTEENKYEYILLMARWRAEYRVKDQLEAFLSGLYELIPQESFQVFDIDELELLINGRKDIDIDEIRAYTIFQGSFDKDHTVVLWFWQAMREFSPEKRAIVLKFCTGADRVPVDGFEPPFNLTEGSDMTDDCLPRTHTCFNQLVLPVYSTYEKLKEKILYAAENSDGFQLS